jgi:hypothetical protein
MITNTYIDDCSIILSVEDARFETSFDFEWFKPDESLKDDDDDSDKDTGSDEYWGEAKSMDSHDNYQNINNKCNHKDTVSDDEYWSESKLMDSDDNINYKNNDDSDSDSENNEDNDDSEYSDCYDEYENSIKRLREIICCLDPTIDSYSISINSRDDVKIEVPYITNESFRLDMPEELYPMLADRFRDVLNDKTVEKPIIEKEHKFLPFHSDIVNIIKEFVLSPSLTFNADYLYIKFGDIDVRFNIHLSYFSTIFTISKINGIREQIKAIKKFMKTGEKPASDFLFRLVIYKCGKFRHSVYTMIKLDNHDNVCIDGNDFNMIVPKRLYNKLEIFIDHIDNLLINKNQKNQEYLYSLQNSDDSDEFLLI